MLLSRSSVAPKTLCSPALSSDEVLILVAAALTAPDHEHLKPYRFILIEGEGRRKLSRTFLNLVIRRGQDIYGQDGLTRSSPTASDNPLILQRVDVEVGRAVLATR